MMTIRNETAGDIHAREALLDRVWGPSRFQKAAERLREGREPAQRLSFVATEGRRLVGTVRLLARLCRAGAAGLAARPACG